MTRNILLYAAVGLIIGGASLYLSYGPLSSDTWVWRYGLIQYGIDESGSNFILIGAVREGLRLVVTLGFFVLSHAWLFSKVSKKYWSGPLHPLSFYRNLLQHGRRRTLVFVAVCLVGAVTYHVSLGPYNMHQVWQEHMGTADLSFREHFLPYLAYLFYTLTMYFMIAIPLMIVIWKSLRYDRARLREGIKQSGETDTGGGGDASQLERDANTAESRFLSVRRDLLEIIDRYVYMAIMLVIYMSFELYSLNITLACPAQHIQKWAAWVVIFYLLPYLLWRGIRAYTRAYGLSVKTLGRLAKSAEKPDGADALPRISELRESFQSKYTFLSFVWLLRKSGSVAVVVFIALVGLLSKYNDFLEFNRRAIPWPVSAAVVFVHDVSTPGAAEEGQDDRHPLAPDCEESLPSAEQWEQYKQSRNR
jgi:hypothetical protein